MARGVSSGSRDYNISRPARVKKMIYLSNKNILAKAIFWYIIKYVSLLKLIINFTMNNNNNHDIQLIK